MCQVSGQSSVDTVFNATVTVSELGEVEKLDTVGSYCPESSTSSSFAPSRSSLEAAKYISGSSSTQSFWRKRSWTLLIHFPLFPQHRYVDLHEKLNRVLGQAAGISFDVFN